LITSGDSWHLARGTTQRLGDKSILEVMHQFCLAGRCCSCSEEHGRLQGDAIHSRYSYYRAPLKMMDRPAMTHWASLQSNQDHTVKLWMRSSPHCSCLLPSSCFCSGKWN